MIMTLPSTVLTAQWVDHMDQHATRRARVGVSRICPSSTAGNVRQQREPSYKHQRKVFN